MERGKLAEQTIEKAGMGNGTGERGNSLDQGKDQHGHAPKVETLKVVVRAVFPCGGKYEGDTINGQKHGVGSYFYANGDIYEGQWSKDLKEGHGRYTSTSGVIYEGQWRAGKREGVGTLKWPNG